jgi:hypothetical protein
VEKKFPAVEIRFSCCGKPPARICNLAHRFHEPKAHNPCHLIPHLSINYIYIEQTFPSGIINSKRNKIYSILIMEFVFPAQLFVAFTFCKSSNLLLMIVPALITNQRQRGDILLLK